MSRKPTKTSRLRDYLEGKIPDAIALDVLRNATFYGQEKELADVIIKVLEKGEPVDAVTIFQNSKSQKLLLAYVTLIQEIDYIKYQLLLHS